MQTNNEQNKDKYYGSGGGCDGDGDDDDDGDHRVPDLGPFVDLLDSKQKKDSDYSYREIRNFYKKDGICDRC